MLTPIADLDAFSRPATAWHTLAERVLAPARHAATGRIGLRVPTRRHHHTTFSARRTVAIEGTELVIADGWRRPQRRSRPSAPRPPPRRRSRPRHRLYTPTTPADPDRPDRSTPRWPRSSQHGSPSGRASCRRGPPRTRTRPVGGPAVARTLRPRARPRSRVGAAPTTARLRAMPVTRCPTSTWVRGPERRPVLERGLRTLGSATRRSPRKPIPTRPRPRSSRAGYARPPQTLDSQTVISLGSPHGSDLRAVGGDGVDRRPAALRTERGRQLVVDALLAYYDEGDHEPGAAKIAARAGVSERTVFRYFDDLDALAAEAVGTPDRADPVSVRRTDAGGPARAAHPGPGRAADDDARPGRGRLAAGRRIEARAPSVADTSPCGGAC